ncbi:hypothetical protein AMS68_002659 [Peltaster fructicola]|uniref:Carrier domain-containing protein n=1 Tax=Peltaster fructicola TaxID=286661 RepID=A0A6H0XQU3_9PEZI|nr:hypothetical protein AMS68_002659 [Peltaster fructicola]
MLLYDESYAELATNSSDLTDNLTASVLPFGQDLQLQDLLKDAGQSIDNPRLSRTDVAYLHHTSGTSTGIPKPIPQSHNAAVGVLPQLASGKDCATFTTTPLYHGGVADFFRAWTSSALIWLFPGKSVPITAGNIIKCLEVAEQSTKKGAPPVKYFSSVPYVLQLLEGEKRGLEFLQSMDMVGVGGAALPVEVGDRLVSKDVNLLSRFGSAECGFLLSSHRDFANDKAWQYLRCAPDQDKLRFEPQETELSELVILKGWPHMAKQNREDGSFATADLFAPHPDIKGAWRYHSRADSQLTLITGKKFDPAPLEADIAASELLSDAIVFGNGQPYPGVLLFKAADISDEELHEALWPMIEKLNHGSQDHAKISKGMMVPMPVLDVPLEKSSKGTLLRAAAESRFERSINQAYNTATDIESVSDDQLSKAIKKIVSNVSHKTLSLQDHTDLFSAGIDSVAGMQIRSRLKALLPQDKRELPMTVVEDCGSIEGLARYVRRQRHGEDETIVDDTAYMLQLVDEYSHFQDASLDPADHTPGQVIVLTGATGALGAHVLDQYSKSESVRKIYCLVRGADACAARERVVKALEQRKLASLHSKVVVLQARLADSDLGLDAATYHQVTREATTIMHVAWSVNFRMRLHSFVKDNIAGVNHLVNLALASPRKPMFAFCSSVASAMSYPGIDIPEKMIDDPEVASPLGYSRSKWVAEQICGRAQSMADRIVIFRVGQLSGDSRHGVWNASEAWPLMLSSTKETGCLPSLNETLDWLPVDLAATALIQGAAHKAERKEPSVYHVVNDNTEPSWMDMITWLQKHEEVMVISPSTWVQRLSLLESEGSTNPALKLLSHWQAAYRTDDDSGSATNGNHIDARVRKTFSMVRSRSEVPVLRQIRPVDEVYFGKLWQWIKKEM